MSKLAYTIDNTQRGKVSFTVHDPRPVQLVRFCGEMQPVEEVTSMLLCSGMNEQQVLDWLERRMEFGRFAKKEVYANA